MPIKNKIAAAARLKLLGIDLDALLAAHAAATETDIVIPDGEPIVLTADEAATRSTNDIAAGKKDGEKEARSIFVTEIAKKIPGLTLTRDRIGDLATEISEFMGKNETEKVKLLTNQVTALQNDKSGLETSLKDFEGKVSGLTRDQELIGYFPSNRGAGLTDIDRLTLIKSGLSFEVVDGVTIAKKNGVVLTDAKTKAPLGLKEVVEGEFTARPVLLGGTVVIDPKLGGRGAGDKTPVITPGGKPTKFTEAVEVWKALDPAKNTNEMSQEFTEYVGGLAKENTSFNMYE